MKARWQRVLVALLALAGAAAPRAEAAIPSAEKVRGAAATANLKGARDRALLVDVVLLTEAGELAASGRARLDPPGPAGPGTARLELVLADGRNEVHERDAAGYRVTRDGTPIERPLPLLLPAGLLQAGSREALAEALRALGGDPERVDLGSQGARDCWVLGGRDRGPFEMNGLPSLWLDLDSHQVVRIDEAAGTRFFTGPYASFGDIRFPAWIEVQAPGWPRWRMEVRAVTPAGGSTP